MVLSALEMQAHLKGTVPSQAMSMPSKRMMMSSGRTSLDTGEVGQMLRTRTPLRGGTSPYARRSPALSMRCHFTPSTGNPVKRPLRLHRVHCCLSKPQNGWLQLLSHSPHFACLPQKPTIQL